MARTDKTYLGQLKSADPCNSRLSNDEGLASMVSSYLDGELSGAELERLEELLRGDDALAREVAELRRIDHQLMEIGSDILSEPVPDSMLEALSSLREPKS